MIMFDLYIGLACWVITSFIVGWLAKRKGRNSLAWGIVGGLFWGASLILLSFLKPKMVSENNTDSQDFSVTEDHTEQ